MLKPVAKPKFSNHSSDPQIQLYKRIGISAVAAVLEVMAKPAKSTNDKNSNEKRCGQQIASADAITVLHQSPGDADI